MAQINADHRRGGPDSGVIPRDEAPADLFKARLAGKFGHAETAARRRRIGGIDAEQTLADLRQR